jgi:hypothetical protein
MVSGRLRCAGGSCIGAYLCIPWLETEILETKVGATGEVLIDEDAVP